MNATTIIILLALLGVLALIVRKIVRDRKNGGGCGCDCASCPGRGSCHGD